MRNFKPSRSKVFPMKKANLIISAAMTVFALVIICISATYPKASAYGTGAPGPGLWPIVISIIVIAMSVLLAVKTLMGAKDEECDEELILIDVDHARVYLSMAILLVYFLVLKSLGFIIPTVLMVTFFVWWFSKAPEEGYAARKARSAFGKKVYEIFNITDGIKQSRPLWFCFIIAVIVTLAVYFIFKLGLSVPMNFGLFYI